MQGGSLRHRVTIERGVVTPNALGQDVTTWEPVYQRVPARVQQLTGRELWNAQQIQPDISLRVSLRWLPDVTSKYRLIWHDGETNRQLEIAAPPLNPDGQRREMILLCKEEW